MATAYSASAPRRSAVWDLGRHVFGAATVASGAVTLVWHNSGQWHHLRYIVYAAAAAQIAGGIAMQFRPTAKLGAAILVAAYLFFAMLCLPAIVMAPRVYTSWGDFFEQFSLLTGAGLVYASFSQTWAPGALTRVGRILLGVCSVSFALEQAFYLAPTVSLVPKWIPPSQTFWALATTVAFALAAAALLTNRLALLGSRLLTAMIVSFGVLVWVPLLFADPHGYVNWSEAAETFAIAGAVWTLADLLGARRSA